MSSDLIYLLLDDKVCGPFDPDIIKRMLETGEINGETRTLISGKDQWMALGDVVIFDDFSNKGEKTPGPEEHSAPNYQNYGHIPFYKKQGFFWAVYFLLPPVALIILVFGDIYYLKKGIVKKFGLINRLVAILILAVVGYNLGLELKPLPDLPAENTSAKAIELHPEAMNGDSAAMVNLYLIYSKGIGVTPDKELASRFLKVAVQKNNPEAQAILGYLYQRGEDAEKDLEKAAVMYRLAADQGNVDAQNNLANMLYFGQGTTRDIAKAAVLYEKAAKQGDVNASAILGSILLHGEGGQRNDERALRLLVYAAEKDHVIAQYHLGCLYLTGNDIVHQSIGNGLKLLKKAADKKLPDALEKLGALYEEGRYVPRDLNVALSYYDQLIASGDDLALMVRARIHQKGLRGEKSEAKAIDFYEKAAATGITAAKIELALIYYNRDSKSKDLNKTLTLLKQAIDARSSYAMLLFGLLYLKGEVHGEYSFQASPDSAISRVLNGPHSSIATLKRGISITADLCKQITETYPKGKPLSLSGHEYLIQQGIWKGAKDFVSYVNKLKADDSLRLNSKLSEALDAFLDIAQTNIGYNEFSVLSSLNDLSNKIEGIETDLIVPKSRNASSVFHDINPEAPPDQRSLMIAKAIELFKLAVQEGSSSAAKFNLALMVRDGVGFAPDAGKAIELLKQSASQGYTASMLVLGTMYHFGEGVAPDPEKAKKYYADAAERKDPLAYLHLGLMLEFGRDSDRDLEGARKLYEMAASEGITEASDGLKRLIRDTDN